MLGISWLDRAWDSVCSHCAYYVWFVGDQWAHLTPVKYAGMLISIGLAGFLLMGRGGKKIR
jgi:hypothetical protein